MAKKKVTFNLEESTIKKVKQLALDKNTTATALYTKWIEKGIDTE
jgi:hypothetical protein